MIDFLWGGAGAAVGTIIVGAVLGAVVAACAGPAKSTPAPTTSDKVIGFIAGIVTAVVLMQVLASLVPGSSFVEKLGLGAGLAVMFGSELLIALVRGHVSTVEPATRTEDARRERLIEPVAFAPEVHRHFAEPDSRARYVLAAYRQGLIPAEDVPCLAGELAPLLPGDVPAWHELASGVGAGVDGAVDRAAREIGYAPTPEEARADVLERLVYRAMTSTDPMVRLATVHLLAPPVAAYAPELPEWDVRRWIESRRLAVVGALAARYDDLLTPGVRQHFEDPTVRARELIAGYRRGVIHSPEVPQFAAEIVADLPGAGEAWTELAMASGAEPRSDLRPVLERAAEEIGYHRTDEEAEEDLLEAAAYRAIATGRVMDESEWLQRLDRYDYEYEFDHGFAQAPALEALRDARYICGDGYYEQIAAVRADVADYLTARYP